MASRSNAADYERPRQVALAERGNVSLRGAYREFSHRFQSAINDFKCVRTLAYGRDVMGGWGQRRGGVDSYDTRTFESSDARV